ncbi:sll0787 family AIR synthase-like protein [Reichenbachiella versicolor]|uniref:sll0787 family AIR synthase-like protein n=1 Tax=Reichenbachiella versicolor TaxID=1821036 RepID=UPI000D6E132D|nr:sll0787 family AIR synthase-like protein [Reichenbachiella versicolor]
MVIEDILTEDIIKAVRSNPYVVDKMNISRTYDKIGSTVSLPKTHHTSLIAPKIQLGDDCTAIPNGDTGYTLFAAEGMIDSFLTKDPWFAGYSAVMVNISDILSMGGIPTALTDVIWGMDAIDIDEIWEGMKAASIAYDVPIVGGHTCYNSESKALAVSIIGTAKNLLTSFDARAGQRLLMAVDMTGHYYKEYPFWNASTTANREALLRKKMVLKEIADELLATAAKDISMGGLFGTIAMLSNTSQVGFNIDFQNIIPAPDKDWVKWLTSFPSFGFVLTCDEENVEAITKKFESENVVCQDIGLATANHDIVIQLIENTIKFN